VIATPTHAIRIKRPSAAPMGIDWTRLSVEDLEEMPILAELMSIGAQKGPRIGVQQGPLCVGGKGLSR